MPNEEKQRIKPVIEEIPTEDPPKPESTEKPAPKEHEEKKTPEHAHPVHVEPTETPKYEMPNKTNIKLIIAITAVTAAIVGALGGGIYVYFNGLSNLKDEGTPTPTPAPIETTSPSPTPAASPSATPKLTTYKIQILNGSGKIGEANKAKALIEKEGFKVINIANASSFDFEETIIQARESVPQSVVDLIKESLSQNYVVEIGTALKATNTYDIIITVGSK